MATNKRFVVKNGLQTENINFVFNDAVLGSSNITATMLSSNTLSFSGSTGQLFSIADSMTGVIFAVNDISGVPSIEVYDDGRITLAETFGNVTIGNSIISSSRTSISTTTGILQVAGGAGITGNINVGGTRNLFTGSVGVGTSAILGASANAFAVYGTAMIYGNVDIANPAGGTSGIYFNDGSYQTTAFTGAATPSFGAAGTIQYAGAGNTFAGNSDNFFWDTANSRLGIGTNSPTNVLTVRSTATPAWFNTVNSAVGSNNFEIIVGNGASTGTTVGYVNNTLVPYGYVSTGTSSRNLVVSANGRVGVGGVTSPQVTLDVGGTTVIGASWAGNTNFINPPANGLAVQGSVGIGTYTPLNALDVRGGMGVTAASNFNSGLSVASLTSNGAITGTTGAFSTSLYSAAFNTAGQATVASLVSNANIFGATLNTSGAAQHASLIVNANTTTSTLNVQNNALVGSLNSNTNVVATNLQSTGLTSVAVLVVNTSTYTNTLNVNTTANVGALTSNTGITVGAGGITVTGISNFTGNINVTGNVNVSGALNVVNSNVLTVNDPIIYLGEGNPGNTFDIGLVGNYNQGTYYHTGIVRDHRNNYWTLFDTLLTEPNVTTGNINWADSSITFADFRVGNINIMGNTQSTSSTSGVIVVNGVGGLGVGGNINAGGQRSVFSGNMLIQGSNTATSATTGALIVQGGVGVGGNIYAAGNVVAASLQPTSASVPQAGLYLPTTNTLALSTNNVERLRVDSTGKVGIGVTPTYTLDVYKNGGSTPDTYLARFYSVTNTFGTTNESNASIQIFGTNGSNSRAIEIGLGKPSITGGHDSGFINLGTSYMWQVGDGTWKWSSTGNTTTNGTTYKGYEWYNHASDNQRAFTFSHNNQSQTSDTIRIISSRTTASSTSTLINATSGIGGIFVVNQGGYIGAGISTPSAMLHVNGNAIIASSNTSVSSTTGALTVTGGVGVGGNVNVGGPASYFVGNVGIGAAASGSRLRVLGSGDPTVNTTGLTVGLASHSPSTSTPQYGIYIDQQGGRYAPQTGLYISTFNPSGMFGGPYYGANVYARSTSQAYQVAYGINSVAENDTANFGTQAYGVKGLGISDNTGSGIIVGNGQGAWGGHFVSYGRGNAVGVYADAYHLANAITGATATPLLVASNSVERMRVTAAGNVGIGSSAPLALLDVASNAGRIRITQNTAGGVLNGIDFVSFNGGINGGLLWNQASGEVRLNAATSYFPTFYSNGTEAMRISTAGLVGVGTTAPTAIFEAVANSAIATSTGISVRNRASTNNYRFELGVGYPGYYDDAALFKFANNIAGYISSTGQWNILTDVAIASNKVFVSLSSGSSFLNLYDASGNTNLSSLNALILSSGSGTERLRIDSTGKVGIGTITPGSTLDVNGIASFRSAISVTSTATVASLVSNGTITGTIATFTNIQTNGEVDATAVVSNTWIHATQNLTVASSNASTTTGTGAAVITGGVGIGGRLNVGGTAWFAGVVNAGGALVAQSINSNTNVVGVNLQSTGQASVASLVSNGAITGTTITGTNYLVTTASSTQASGAAIQRVFNKTVAATELYKLAEYSQAEGIVAIEIQVASLTSANSGTTTYRFQGGYSSLTGSYYRLMPFNDGRGHGEGPDTGFSTLAWEVYIYGTTVSGTQTTYGVAVSVPTGAVSKTLITTITELRRGMTFADKSADAVVTSFTNSGNIYSHRNLLIENRVGIATTAPGSTLDVNGIASFRSAISVASTATVASLVSNGAVSGTTGTFTGALYGANFNTAGTATVNALSSNGAITGTTGAFSTSLYSAAFNTAGTATVAALVSNGAITGTTGTFTSIQNSGLERAANIVSNTWIHATQNLTVASSNASITTSTGALVVTGGVGIGGSINAGGSLNVIGDAVVGANLQVQGGNITTAQTGTAFIFNSNIAGLDIGRSTSVINMSKQGAAAVYVHGDLVLGNKVISSYNGGTASIFNTNIAALNIGGESTITNIGKLLGVIYTPGDISVNGGDIFTTAATGTLFNSNVTTLSIGQAASTLNIGANSGTLIIGNPTVRGTQTTQSLYNTVATTLNFGGAATTITVGASTGTTTFNSTNPSTTTATGAAVITGGLGVGGNINVGGTRNLFTGSVGVGTSAILGASANVLSIYGTAMVYGNIDLANPTGGTSGLYFNDGTYQTTAFTGAGTPSSGVAGTVQFAGAGSTFSGDAANFFWDDTNNRLGLGTQTPQTRLSVGTKVSDDSTYTYDNNSVYIVHQTATSTTVLNDPKEVLLLARQGTSGQAYGAAAAFSISRYENNSVNSRTRLDLTLAHGAFLTSGATTVLTALSSGAIGIGTTLPTNVLTVASTTTPAWFNTVNSAVGSNNFEIIVGNGTSTGTTVGYVNNTTVPYGYVSTGTSTRNLVVSANGRVGIGGVTSPQVTLDVGGTAVVGATWAGNTNFINPPANGLAVQGSVGIGTYTPLNALDVRGGVGVTAASNFGGGLSVASLTSNGAITGTTGAFSTSLYSATFNTAGTATVAALVSNGAITGTTGAFSTSLYGATFNTAGTATVAALVSNGAVSGTNGTFTGALYGGSFNTAGTATVAALVSNTSVKTATVNASSTIVGQNIYSNGFVQAAGTVEGQAIDSNTTITAGTGLTVTSGGVNISGVSQFTGNVNIAGNLNVTGTISTQNANVLVVQDPIIYLGEGNTGNNWDLGLVGNYNDGVYEHTGLVRNHVTSTWTLFDTLPTEPNVNTGNIDWTNSSLTYAAFLVGNVNVAGQTASISTTTGAIRVPGTGGVGIGGRLNVGGSAWFAGVVNAGGALIAQSINSNTNVVGVNLQSTGAASVASLASNGAITGTTGAFSTSLYSAAFNTAGTATVAALVSNGAITGTTITGTFGTFTGTQNSGLERAANIVSNTWIHATQNLTVASSNASTTTGTGAAVITGGVGIGGRLNVGGTAWFAGVVNAGGALVAQSINSNTNVVGVNLQSTGQASVASLASNGAITGTTGAFSTSLYSATFNTAGTATVAALVSNGAITGTTGTFSNATGPQISFTGGTSNWLAWNSAGVAAPAFTTRSIGTKLLLYPAVAAASADYAIGIEGSTIWSSVPTTTEQFKWYGGTTQAMLLSGVGALTTTSTTTSTAFIPNSATVPTNGMYLPAANTVGFATNSAARMRITSIGNVLINTSTAPLNGNATVTIQGIGTNGPGVQLSTGAGGILFDGLVGGGATFKTHTGAIGSETYTERMRIDSVGNVGIGTSTVQVGYKLQVQGSIKSTGTIDADVQFLGQPSDTATAPSFSWTGDTNVGMYRPTTDTIGFTTAGNERMRIDASGNVGIGTSTIQAGYKLQVQGGFAAITKSFVIDHPTKPGMKLQYGSLEGPENGVYIRGRLTGSDIIVLPDYWVGLVDKDTVTVDLTAVGSKQDLWVTDIKNNTVTVGSTAGNIDCFYTVYAERKDIDKLIVEYGDH